MSSSKTAVPYLLTGVLCFCAVFWILYDYCAIRQKPKTVAYADAASAYNVSESVDSALNVRVIIPKADFAPNVGSPFKALGARTAVGSSRKLVTDAIGKPRRSSIRLKGLMKNPPLAILEDTRGETYIKARGDSIQNSRIIAINDNSVVFKDSGGTYELIVEENK